MAKTSLKVKQTRKPKYSTRAYTRCKVSALRTQEVWHLPYLLQRACIQGRDPWCQEGKLVKRKLLFSQAPHTYI